MVGQDVPDTHGAPAMTPELVEIRPLSVSCLGDGQEVVLVDKRDCL